MIKAKRGGRKRDHRSDRAEQSSSSWKPLNQDQTLTPKLTSTSKPQKLEPTATTGEPISNSGPRISKHTRNPKWVSRNQHEQGVKPGFLKKSDVSSSNSEMGFLDNEVGSSNPELGILDSEKGSLRIDERVDGQVENEIVEKDEREGGGNGSGSNNEEETIDVTDILEELSLSVEEPELSEEQLRTNFQSQQDELLALESIYGEDIFVFDRQRGLKYFQVHIHIEAPNGITFTTKLNSSGDLKTIGDNTDELSHSFKIQYFPPVVLTCLLPESYPSHLPPYFTITVQWLDSVKIANLCSVLDSLWNAQPGQEVLYQWVEWLNSSSLSYLGFDKEIMLGPYGIKHTIDRRAVSRSVSPDMDVHLIRSYNDERLNEIFQQNIHECCICFSEYAGAEFIRLPCHHFFCWKCMKTYTDIHINEGTVSKLQCPDAKCRAMVPPSLLKQLLSGKEYERWESLMLEKTLECMSDVVYCPRCETPCIEDEDQHAQCSTCFFSFCTLCREPRHVGAECMTPEMKLQVLLERLNSPKLKGDKKHKERSKINEKINEIRSIKAIFRDARQCPSCKVAISRTEGCNMMTCSNCSQKFCYRCNKAIVDYSHFSKGSCDENGDLEEGLNRRQVEALMQAVLFSERDGHREICPKCRQINVKVGKNNHLFCWSCRIHYCYLCKKIVKHCNEHYGPKGCKQFTKG